MSDRVTLRLPAEADLGLFNRHRPRCNCPPLGTGDELAVTSREALSLKICADRARQWSPRSSERSALARLTAACRDARRRLDDPESVTPRPSHQ